MVALEVAVDKAVVIVVLEAMVGKKVVVIVV